MKLDRKIKHSEKVCRIHDLGSNAKGHGRSQFRGQKCVPAITKKTTEANLSKLRRKIEHNEKVCCTQELGSYAQGQGHDQVNLSLKSCCS